MRWVGWNPVVFRSGLIYDPKNVLFLPQCGSFVPSFSLTSSLSFYFSVSVLYLLNKTNAFTPANPLRLALMNHFSNWGSHFLEFLCRKVIRVKRYSPQFFKLISSYTFTGFNTFDSFTATIINTKVWFKLFNSSSLCHFYQMAILLVPLWWRAFYVKKNFVSMILTLHANCPHHCYYFSVVYD